MFGAAHAQADHVVERPGQLRQRHVADEERHGLDEHGRRRDTRTSEVTAYRTRAEPSDSVSPTR